MKADLGTLVSLAGHFAALSLVAFGGVNAVLPEMHREAVEVTHWMTDRQFADLFAIAQAAPGPNVVIATLVGFQVAGLNGAAVATIAMCGPTCVVAYFVGRMSERFAKARWRIAVQTGLVPVSVGLVGASALVLARAADHNPADVALTLITAGVALATKLNPVWMLTLAALIGLAGFA